MGIWLGALSDAKRSVSHSKESNMATFYTTSSFISRTDFMGEYRVFKLFKDCQQHKGMTAWCRAMCYTVPSLLPFIANPFQQQQLPLGVETDAQLGMAYCCLTRPLILDPPNNITFSQPFLMFSVFFPR